MRMVSRFMKYWFLFSVVIVTTASYTFLEIVYIRTLFLWQHTSILLLACYLISLPITHNNIEVSLGGFAFNANLFYGR